VIEVRWHARAGQGAKSAAQILALGFLHSGSYAQAFPEYGPERRGAPLRAYTRASETPIRRHDSVTDPDLVVVLEPSLLEEIDVGDGRVLVVEDHVAKRKDVNLVMLGQTARELGAPPLEDLQAAAVEVLGKKASAESIRASLEEGYACRS
jgi:Pyruvate/2-oxoacid:ferredoxin oxidoreductase gamma subunit